MVRKISKIKYFLQLGGNPLLIYPFGLGAKRLCDSSSAETWVTWVWLISAETWVTWVWLISARDMSCMTPHPGCISISFISHCSLGCGYYRFVYVFSLGWSRLIVAAIILWYDFPSLCFWGDSVCFVLCHFLGTLFWARYVYWFVTYNTSFPLLKARPES